MEHIACVSNWQFLFHYPILYPTLDISGLHASIMKQAALQAVYTFQKGKDHIITGFLMAQV